MQAGREVKFKAWLHEEKVMVDVIEINFPEKYVCFYDCTGLTDAEAFELMRNGIPNADCLFENCSLRQFTGLRDKNGKEIFEEDILETRDDDGSFYLKVIYDEEYARYWFVDEADNGYCYAPDEFDRDEILVIGNIYENPELLEVGN